MMPQGYARAGPGRWGSVADTDQRDERGDEAEQQDHPAREQYDHGTDGEQYGATGESKEPDTSELTDRDSSD